MPWLTLVDVAVFGPGCGGVEGEVVVPLVDVRVFSACSGGGGEVDVAVFGADSRWVGLRGPGGLGGPGGRGGC